MKRFQEYSDIGAGYTPASTGMTNAGRYYYHLPTGNQRMAFYSDIGAIRVDEIGDPPSWLQTIANTGLEAYRVREGRRAMSGRPLTPEEMSLYTRGNNTMSLPAFGSGGTMIAIAALLGLAFIATR